MSHHYQAVNWNRQKRIYDGLLAVGVEFANPVGQVGGQLLDSQTLSGVVAGQNKSDAGRFRRQIVVKTHFSRQESIRPSA